MLEFEVELDENLTIEEAIPETKRIAILTFRKVKKKNKK
jgi:hypothetical protein